MVSVMAIGVSSLNSLKFCPNLERIRKSNKFSNAICENRILPSQAVNVQVFSSRNAASEIGNDDIVIVVIVTEKREKLYNMRHKVLHSH